MEPVELWILDRLEEPVECPNCEIDLADTILNKTFQLNKQRRWSHRVSIRCPFCKKMVSFEVEWIPEFVTAKAIEL